MTKTKTMSKKKVVLLILLSIAVVLLAVYFGIGVYFKSHFLFRTQINGVDCAKKTVAEVEQLIMDEIDDYQLTLTGRGEEEVIKGQKIQLKPVFDGSLNQVLEACNHFAWPLFLFQPTVVELETMVEYDEAKLSQAIEDLNGTNPKVMEAPKDAYKIGRASCRERV